MTTTEKIIANLWFDNQAEEAVHFYTSVFKNSKIGSIARYGNEGFEIHGRPAGSVMTIEFWLNGQSFVALNGGPVFKFTEAVSFIITCDDQEEVDYYWNKLTDGGDETAQVCGWLKDKFGLSWQVVPKILQELMKDATPGKAGKAMTAMMQMKKIDIENLRKAADS